MVEPDSVVMLLPKNGSDLFTIQVLVDVQTMNGVFELSPLLAVHPGCCALSSKPRCLGMWSDAKLTTWRSAQS